MANFALQLAQDLSCMSDTDVKLIIASSTVAFLLGMVAEKLLKKTTTRPMLVMQDPPMTDDDRMKPIQSRPEPSVAPTSTFAPSENIVLPPSSGEILNGLRFELWRSLLQWAPSVELKKELRITLNFVQWVCQSGDGQYILATAEKKSGYWSWDLKSLSQADYIEITK